MVIVLSGGGTAGHINPALALAEELKRRDHQVLFAGTPQGVEARLVGQTDIPFTAFEASGFNRRHPASLAKGVAKIARSTAKAKKWFAEVKPDVVVGFGGYVCIPVARAAEQLGIPVVLHEQNSHMGMANQFLSKKAAAVALTYGECAGQAKGAGRVTVTGNPVRRSVAEASRAEGRRMLGIPEDDLMLLVFGGSLGARSINDAVVSLKQQLLGRPNLSVVHIAGPREYDRVAEALALTEDEKRHWQLLAYQDRMGETLAAADVIVSRAGATSLAEISALAIPALLVPYPYATEDHQTKNARSYVEAGCADWLADDQLAGAEFAAKLNRLLDDGQLRAQMTEAARRQPTVNAARNLADVVEESAKA
ncbi:undecaprenyldiphospho-muramoylpentapeptide beta-N-acetylglucosaminyltransferase [Parvibacter caecicola]|uniref:UDP-N-acetylglucosamine--N-acetylmuramyl-(pentapeptide) pyrophosphoryl-undecaprenol N-acetylglucosamine transferase n=1 Tax=Parvibacter caecicola TaxID=747645 RepID=A0A4T9TCE8_9ACTN|nr:undecaprenyldiphospho-muramoylpentapeptide beta-N-acetylglucosaminyltransferase [Parvibacter caecicola]TJW12486.1 undecaprenyldiphospho-muramoylpentapeptide beta-N-acetylglucosaminyltransferase [Parvibacter caecicola]